MKKFVLSFALAAVALAAASPASAALNAYLKIKGQKQGEIKGSVTAKGKENSIQVFGVSHEISSPRDSASGMATGRVQHSPLMVTIPVDKATPLLFQALNTNENLPEVTIDFYRGPGKGAGAVSSAVGIEQLYYKLRLTNASVSSVIFMSTTPGDDRVSVTFVYQKIEETIQDGGITSEQEWGAQQP